MMPTHLRFILTLLTFSLTLLSCGSEFDSGNNPEQSFAIPISEKRYTITQVMQVYEGEDSMWYEMPFKPNQTQQKNIFFQLNQSKSVSSSSDSMLVTIQFSGKNDSSIMIHANEHYFALPNHRVYQWKDTTFLSSLLNELWMDPSTGNAVKPKKK